MAAGTLLFQLAPNWLLSLFESDAAGDAAANTMLSELGVPVLRIISISFIMAACGIMFSCLFQAVGKGVYSMMMSLCRQLLVLLPVAFVLSKFDMQAMWYSFPIAEVVCLMIAIVLFLILRKKELSKLDSVPDPV